MRKRTIALLLVVVVIVLFALTGDTNASNLQEADYSPLPYGFSAGFRIEHGPLNLNVPLIRIRNGGYLYGWKADIIKNQDVREEAVVFRHSSGYKAVGFTTGYMYLGDPNGVEYRIHDIDTTSWPESTWFLLVERVD